MVGDMMCWFQAMVSVMMERNLCLIVVVVCFVVCSCLLNSFCNFAPLIDQGCEQYKA